jgi:hypothetical protein
MLRRARRAPLVLLLTVLAGLAMAAVAQADWDGDGKGDVLAVAQDGRLLMYRGNGSGGFQSPYPQIGSGWGGFTAILSPGDWSGDGHPDLLARTSVGKLLLYRGNGTGGFVGPYPQIGSGWGGFTAIVAPGDWNGDGHPDLLARTSDGKLLLYRGNGTGGFVGPYPQIGAGWQGFTALAAGGDFSGDGKPDVLARTSDGKLRLYRGNGTGGFTSPYPQIGSGWGGFTTILLVSALARPAQAPPPAPAPTPPPEPAAPPSAPVPDGNVNLHAGLRCTPVGGRLSVNLKIRRRAGHGAPRVRRVVFFIRNGPRRTDHHRPFAVKLRPNRPAGSRGRVYARVYFKRPGSKRLRHKTVSRRFVMCG